MKIPEQAFSTPILLLLYNRPEHTKQLINTLRKIKPIKIYVSADGPNDKKPEDNARCEETRNMVKSIDWECNVTTLYQHKNLGCANGVSTAINWFFEQEEEGIILEDDIQPSISFFSFCEELLEKYRMDSRVMMISAINESYSYDIDNSSYFFSIYPNCWGWATWRRAWKYYDHSMEKWKGLRDTNWISDKVKHPKIYKRYRGVFELVSENKLDSWAYRWVFANFCQAGLTIIPTKNLAKNIGFGTDSTHTNNPQDSEAYLVANEIDLPLVHPECLHIIEKFPVLTPYNKLKKKLANHFK